MQNSVILFLIVFVFSCQNQEAKENQSDVEDKQNEFVVQTVTGNEIVLAPPSSTLLEKLEDKRSAYLSDTTDVEALIWYGRFLAYAKQYQEAIALYSNGIKRFPNEPRLYRHRGHRYITIRNFDLAIDDFEHAVTLISGKENEIEPDGMPNAQGIPVSTLHGNIWYHLGLAYYLKHDFENARRAYEQCFASTSNDDNVVSSTHWLYMIARRMNDQEGANRYLLSIQDTMNVIENMSYHQCCRFYKDLISYEDWTENNLEGSATEAVTYGIGNWHFYNNEEATARELFEELLNHGSWASFGYIAAEADWKAHFMN